MTGRGRLPAPLDLSPATLFVPSPRMNLRRSASYQNEKANHDRTPISATSSRFSFNHLLLASPPASPRLPALVPPPKKSPILHPKPRSVFRGLFWGVISLAIIYMATAALQGNTPLSIPYLHNEHFDMVAVEELPHFASPIVITDLNGHAKWTVSIPAELDFPLSVEEYGGMCGKCREAAARVRDMQQKDPPPQQTGLGKKAPHDKYFVDITDAEEKGLLPDLPGSDRPTGHIIGTDYQGYVHKPICERSMTFVLETTDAGIGNSVMELWLFYGIAKKQGRAFFIDDSRWAYGAYSDVFKPPPIPDCRPPPRHHILPCPLEARHLVVSSATVREMWGETLNVPFPEGQAYDKGSKELFKLASEGYHALFKLTTDDEQYVADKVKKTRAKAKSKDSFSNSDGEGTVIGMHVRHGDRRPLEHQYRSSYIPISAFTDKAASLAAGASAQAPLSRRSDDDTSSFSSPDHHQQPQAEDTSVHLIASDDPKVYDLDEFATADRAQERIRLAGKQDVGKETKPSSRRSMHRFQEEAFGWEGGFYGAMFWNLGLTSMSHSNAATAENMKLVPTEETLKLRSYIARAYLLDLTVLARASDHVVCTVSATGCRMMAVMMGWERAFEEGRWVNIDGEYGWSALSW